jgi:hypothetical protein
MLFGIVLLVAIYFTYVLLIKGLLWKMILGIAGWFGLYIGLQTYIPESHQICITITEYTFSWAAVIPTIVVLLAMAYTRDE